jgi:hypothetical protein
MKYCRILTMAAMAAAMVFSATTARAQDGYWDRYHDRQDLRRDYARVERLRADIARDQYRLNENLRCGRNYAAERDARDLARDQRALAGLLRDIRHDRRDLYWDRRDYTRDSYRDYNWNGR